MLHTVIYNIIFLFDNSDSILGEESSSSDSYDPKYSTVKDAICSQLILKKIQKTLPLRYKSTNVTENYNFRGFFWLQTCLFLDFVDCFHEIFNQILNTLPFFKVEIFIVILFKNNLLIFKKNIYRRQKAMQ